MKKLQHRDTGCARGLVHQTLRRFSKSDRGMDWTADQSQKVSSDRSAANAATMSSPWARDNCLGPCNHTRATIMNRGLIGL
jgi:hypothetical protein